MPLGLRNTHLPPRTSNALPAPHPNGYQFGTNVETMATQVLPPDQQDAAKAGILKPLDATHDNPSWGWTAGAGISTAEESLTWTRRVRVVRGRGRLPAEHITTTEDIAMTTRRESLERPLAGTGRGHQVAAMTRLEIEA